MALSQSDAANFAMAVKQAQPGISDADLAALVKEAGDVNEDPAKSAALAAKIAPQAVPAPMPTMPTSSPRGVSLDVPTSYNAPTPANPDFTSSLGNAGAGLMQGNIDAVRASQALASQTGNLATQQAAEQAYQQSIANNARARTAANFMASTGGPLVSAESAKQWDNLNAQNKDLTLGAVTRQQDFAKTAIANYQSGVTMADNVLDQMDKSGKFQIDANRAALEQKKLQLELVGTAASTGVTQKLMDANSDLSKAARNSAIVMLKQTGLYTDAQIAKMVPPTMTGIEAAPIAKMSGDNLEALLKKGNTNQANGAAAASYAAAGLSAATAQKEKVATAGMVQGQTYNAAQMGMPKADYAGVGAKGVYGNAMPQEVAASNAEAQTRIARQGGTNAGPTTAQTNGGGPSGSSSGYQMQPTVSPTGEVSWQTSTYSQQAGRNASEALAGTTQSVNNYQINGGKDAAQKALVQAPTMGGVNVRNVIGPMGNSGAKQYQLTLDRLNQEAADIGLIANKSGATGTGAAMGAAGAQMARQGGVGAVAGTALAAGGNFFNGGQPVTATTDPKTVQALAIAVQEARAKQAALIPTMRAYAQRNGGDLSGFSVEQHAPKVANAITMINPATGEVSLAYSPQEATVMAKDGLKQKKTILGQ